MNARELLAEVQKVGYTEGKPNYEAILSFIDSKKPELSRAVQQSAFRQSDRVREMTSPTEINNLLDSIDQYVQDAMEIDQYRDAMNRPPPLASSLAATHFKIGYGSLIRQLEELNEINSYMIDNYRGKPKFNTLVKSFTDAIPEVSAQKELVTLYTEALLAAKQLQFLMK